MKKCAPVLRAVAS